MALVRKQHQTGVHTSVKYCFSFEYNTGVSNKCIKGGNNNGLKINSMHTDTEACYLEGPLISMGPHVNLESRIVRKLLVASRTAEARSISGLVECSLEMGQHVLLQCTVGDEAATAGLHWAFQRRLTSVGQPMQVQALLGHAAVTTKVTLNLSPSWRM